MRVGIYNHLDQSFSQTYTLITCKTHGSIASCQISSKEVFWVQHRFSGPSFAGLVAHQNLSFWSEKCTSGEFTWHPDAVLVLALGEVSDKTRGVQNRFLHLTATVWSNISRIIFCIYIFIYLKNILTYLKQPNLQGGVYFILQSTTNWNQSKQTIFYCQATTEPRHHQILSGFSTVGTVREICEKYVLMVLFRDLGFGKCEENFASTMLWMEEIWLTSWYGKYVLLFTGFHTSQVVQDFHQQ